MENWEKERWTVLAILFSNWDGLKAVKKWASVSNLTGCDCLKFVNLINCYLTSVLNMLSITVTKLKVEFKI